MAQPSSTCVWKSISKILPKIKIDLKNYPVHAVLRLDSIDNGNDDQCINTFQFFYVVATFFSEAHIVTRAQLAYGA